MLKVRDVLKPKSTNICSISVQATAYRALQIIAENKIGALIVTDRGRMVGIFSEHDCHRRKILNSKLLRKTPVKEFMSSNVFTISPEKSIKECKAFMTETRSSHLPVFENNQLIGIICADDLFKSQEVSEKKRTCQQ